MNASEDQSLSKIRGGDLSTHKLRVCAIVNDVAIEWKQARREFRDDWHLATMSSLASRDTDQYIWRVQPNEKTETIYCVHCHGRGYKLGYLGANTTIAVRATGEGTILFLRAALVEKLPFAQPISQPSPDNQHSDKEARTDESR